MVARLKKLRFLSACTFSSLLVSAVIVFINVQQVVPLPTTGKENNPQLFTYAGAIHVHSNRSDGSGVAESIAYAAQTAGAQFVVMADHSVSGEARSDNGYYDSVLVMAGCEVNKEEGHFLYIPHPDSTFHDYSTYVLEHLYDFDEDALIIGAHPDLKKKPIDKSTLQKINALEAVNADVYWRESSVLNLAQAFIMYPFSDASLNLLYYYPEYTLKLWNDIQQELDDNYVIFGSTDAHAKIKLNNSWHIPFPSYERTFKMVQTSVVLQEPMSGELSQDSRLIFNALKKGNSFISFENLGDSEGFLFYAEIDCTKYLPGDTIDRQDFAPEIGIVSLQVHVPLDKNVRVYLKSPTRTIAMHDGSKSEFNIAENDKYYVEVYQLRSELVSGKLREELWIISNAIWVNI